MLDKMILGMLCQQPMTGYTLKKYLEQGVGAFYRASFGSIYPALAKMEGRGEICLVQPQEQAGGRQKKCYRVTPQGKEVFFHWLGQPIDIRDSANTHLAKVFFFDQLPGEVADSLLEQYEQGNLEYLNQLLALEKVMGTAQNHQAHYFKLSTLAYGICSLRETIRWCRHVRGKQPLDQLTK